MNWWPIGGCQFISTTDAPCLKNPRLILGPLSCLASLFCYNILLSLYSLVCNSDRYCKFRIDWLFWKWVTKKWLAVDLAWLGRREQPEAVEELLQGSTSWRQGDCGGRNSARNYWPQETPTPCPLRMGHANARIQFWWSSGAHGAWGSGSWLGCRVCSSRGDRSRGPLLCHRDAQRLNSLKDNSTLRLSTSFRRRLGA